MFTRILTTGLSLKLLQKNDNDALFCLIDNNREHLGQWLPFVKHTVSPDDSMEFIEKSLKQWKSNDGFHTGIWLNEELVGVIGFHYMNFHARKTSLGYWVGKRWEGRGIVSRACRTMITYAFEERGLNRVVIKAPVENRRSRNIPDRLGFTLEGILRADERIDETFVDIAVYGLLKSEWTESDF